MTDPAPDVRVGSTTDGLTPVSVAERSLAAGVSQWVGLLAIASAAILADQVTKHIVRSTLAVDGSEHVIGPLSLHRVQNSGIAFGFFSSATAVVRSDSIPAAVVAISVRFSWLSEWIESRLALD